MNSGEKGVYVVHAGNQIHPNSNMTQLISFSDLTGGTDSVRFTVINGGTYMSVRDIIMVVCKKDNNMAGEVWRNTSDKQKEELQDFLLNFQFPGQGQRVQPGRPGASGPRRDTRRIGLYINRVLRRRRRCA